MAVISVEKKKIQDSTTLSMITTSFNAIVTAVDFDVCVLILKSLTGRATKTQVSPTFQAFIQLHGS